LFSEEEKFMFKKSFVQFLIIGLVIGLLTSVGLAAEKSNDKLSRADEKFVKEAAEGGMLEVELGKLAADKATNDEVKAFGRRMQEDHSKANEELKQIADNKDVKIPSALEGKQKRTLDRLSKLSGSEFDRQYMRTMVDDHKEDVKAFQREADKAKDPDIKQFAGKYAPIIKEHLQLAQSTAEQLKTASKKTR
jgi:putative membrane protein